MNKMILLDRNENYLCSLNPTLSAKNNEVLNVEDILNLELDLEVQIEKKNRILVYVERYHYWKEFIVEEVVENRIEGMQEVYSESSINELFGDFIDNSTAYNTTADIALRRVLVNSRWEVGRVDDLGYASVNFYRTSAKEGLDSILEAWNCDLEVEIEVYKNKIVARRINLLEERGSYLGERFVTGDNIESITRTITAEPIATALYGFGKGVEIEDEEGEATGGYGRRLDFGEINDGKMYVEDEEARLNYGRLNSDGTKSHIFGKIEFDDIEDMEELKEATKERLEELKNPKVIYEGIVLGSESKIGDSVLIIDQRNEPELRVLARILEQENDLLVEGNSNPILGNYTSDITKEWNERFAKLDEFGSKTSIWDRANIIGEDGTIGTQFLDGYIDVLKNKIISTQSGWYTDDVGNIVLDAKDGSSSMMLSGAGFMIANSKLGNGNWDYRTFGTGDGFTADEIVAGALVGGKVKFDLSNGTLLIGNSVDDFSLYFDGTKLHINLGGKTIEKVVEEEISKAPIHTWIRYSTDPYGADMTDKPEGAKYIGRAFNQTVKTPSIYPSDYEWLPITGDAGKDAAISTLTASVLLVNTDYNGDGGDYTDINTELEIYVGGKKDTENWDITGALLGNAIGELDGNKYSISDMSDDRITYTFRATKEGFDDLTNIFTVAKSKEGKRGLRGDIGPQGIPGEKGEDGEQLYTWIKYADDEEGTNMSDYPTDKMYMGIAYNQTEEEESIEPYMYEWSKVGGEQGIQGKKGEDGIQYYTWIKYADDEEGTNMTNSAKDKRYLGIAENKTEITPSTNPEDYTWTALFGNIEVGGRNLLQGTAEDEWITFGARANIITKEGERTMIVKATSQEAGYSFGIQQSEEYRALKLKEGRKYTLSFLLRGNIESLNYMYIMNEDELNQELPHLKGPFSTTKFQKVKVTFTANELVELTDLSHIMISSRQTNVGKWFELQEVQLEEGDVATDYSESPEDIDRRVNDKASVKDLSDLNVEVGEITEEIKGKVNQSIFDNLEREHSARQDDIAQSVEEANGVMDRITERTAVIETWLGEASQILNFIDTTITSSEDGILIANGNTGILIANDRISFLDNKEEVAHITSQRLYINHGVFVESLKVGNHKIDYLSGNDITTIKFMNK